MKVKHLLILEPEIAGHHPLYVSLLYNYLIREKLNLKVTFVVAPSIVSKLEKDNIKFEAVNDVVNIVFLNKAELSRCLHTKLWIRAIHAWNVMKKYMKVTGADHGYFLYLDYMPFPLALRFPFLPDKKVSGLLFRPSVHDIYINKESTFKEKIINWRKRLFYRLMLNNSTLFFVHTLDPYFTPYARQHFPNGHKVFHLPDPSMFPTDRIYLSDDDCVLANSVIKENRKLFILFGGLTRRKGVMKVMEAIEFLEVEYASQIVLIFAGLLHEEIRSECLKKVASYKIDNINGATSSTKFIGHLWPFLSILGN